MKIVNTDITYVEEPLKSPFGFKGGALTVLWQVVCKITTQDSYGIGVGVQSVLWSDAEIFATHSEKDGNLLMYRISQKALELLQGKEAQTPIALIDGIYDALLEYAKAICGGTVRETFVKNALVAVDNALWVAYGRQCKEEDLCKLPVQEYVQPLTQRQKTLCNIPLVTYHVSETEIEALLRNGVALLKIKIGNDKDRTKKEMLAWDKARLAQIHAIAKKYKSPYTQSGNILYYLDANGRYDSKEDLLELLSYAQQIGAKERIVLLEEPFDEENCVDVSDLPVRICADESVHSAQDVERRIGLGYSAIALKPIAKTLSETLKIIKVAQKHGVVCFCADLTVNPLMVEWNKNIAARIAPLPEMKAGVLESNGEQNYVHWETMKGYAPCFAEMFAKCENGTYHLNDAFFDISGGIFRKAEYYESLF